MAGLDGVSAGERTGHVGAEAEHAEPSVREIYSDKQVKIVSDESLTVADARALAERCEAAYRFDAKAQGWSDTRPLETPLTVAVLSRGAFASVTGDSTGSVGGVTVSPNVFVVPDTVLGRRSALDENVIAHELGHVQDLREAGKAISKVPIYLQEGKEYVLGETYPLSEKMKNPHLVYVAQALGNITGADARDVMQHFRTVEDEAKSGPRGFIGETTGALYVEFLRTRLSSVGPGQGKPDAMHRVANVISSVGKGASYDAAFKAQFGVSSRESETQFVAYVAATEGNPRARLSGTVFN